MGFYRVEIPFLTHNVDDIIYLNPRQAKYHLLSGVISDTAPGYKPNIFSIDQHVPGTTDSVSVKPDAKTIYVLLDAVTTNQISPDQVLPAGRRTIHAFIAGTGAVSATVNWYGKNRAGDPGVVFATSTLAGTTTDSTGMDIVSEWPVVYCILSDISGTDAAVTATVSI